MKKLLVFIVVIFSSLSFVFAQQGKDIVTEKHKVDGTCNMCKKRIENAAYVKGVKRAEWNKETHELTVTYKPSKTNTETILSAVAKAGHNTDEVPVTESDYNKLPECCQYKTNTCNE